MDLERTVERRNDHTMESPEVPRDANSSDGQQIVSYGRAAVRCKRG